MSASLDRAVGVEAQYFTRQKNCPQANRDGI
jgi:hypothetical protein